MKRYSILKAGIAIISLFASTANLAQATRTWVSGLGDDVNPCSRTAPCKTFAGAISKTATGGEINALDPAGYGAVTIMKSMTIDGTGTNASILASMTNGIIINAGTDGVVVLRHLNINGAGNGINGIRILAAQKVVIEDCYISNFTQKGIELNSTSPCSLVLNNVIIHHAADGLGMNAAGVTAIIDGCKFQNLVNTGISVTAGKAVLSNSNISNCGTAISGSVSSAKNNLLAGNGSNGSFVGAVSLQ
jgi:hypothetical protein